MIDRAELDRWMTAAAEGERAAVEPLFQALWPAVVGYATRLLGDRALAEDCAQDAMVQLFGQLGRYDRGRDALTWALAITTWRCRSARREQGRQAARQAPVTPQLLDGVAAIEQRDLVRHALAAIADLAPRDAEAIARALLDAPDLDVAPATLRKRLERALARLRLAWRSRHGAL